jgi:uncharacterized protein YbbC (DUF1343 family)
MRLNLFKNTVLLFVVIVLSCGNSNKQSHKPRVIVGANQLEHYFPLIKGKNIGVVANQTSVIFKTPNKDSDYNLLQNDNANTKLLVTKTNPISHTHLVDSLLSLGIQIRKVFAPEHGYRGKADAGEFVKDGVDIKSGIPIVSLYGTKKKPNREVLSDLDLIIFDIQGVGARFYTFVSTLHYMMETCAELGIPVLVLDRPNPNGHFIDGPVLDMTYSSFVGMHPVPIVHGMTIGEYAQMINGEGWLDSSKPCDLTVIPLANYDRNIVYDLPIKPSPNLPNAKAINLYPSLCLFEGTNVSAGRGTSLQFQIFGSPFLSSSVFDYSFTPQPNFGAKFPMHKNKLCFGKNLSQSDHLNLLNLEWLKEAYDNTADKNTFFNPFFTKLAGQELLQKQIEEGWSTTKIRNSWVKDLEAFKTIRSHYLLYR